MTIMLNVGWVGWSIMLGVLACLFVLPWIAQTLRIPRGLRLPPGPPGKFIFGNVSDMPTHHEWKTFARWGEIYGDLVYVKLLGLSMIFVNSADVAHELFEKRSSRFNDRFPFTMVNELMGFDWNFGFMRYGQKWRQHRRMFHERFHPKAATAYHSVQIRHARSILRKLLQSPDDFTQHIRHFSGAIIMEIIYGIQVLEKDDPYVKTAGMAMAAIAEAAIPGTFLVDVLPILKHVPAWLPGAGFRRKARAWRVPIVQMIVKPFIVVKEALSAGTAQPSFTASLIEELSHKNDPFPNEEETIRNAAGVAYFAGADTTVSALSTFILAMVMYPDAQARAKAELDSVIGMDRLPEFEDRESLPYVNALCKEVLRWNPVVPLGIAHRVTQDDVYGEYFIPKGCIVVGNAWAILHNESLYGPDTEEFKPERFLKPGVKPPIAAFGFGRRICPGRHLADNSLFIAVTSILKVFEISPATGQSGNDIPVTNSVTSGFLSYPEPFKCAIKPRSAAAQSLAMKRANN